MNRVRISTTVDGGRLTLCRRLLAAPDSQLMDRALQALVNELEAERELAALEAHPYREDPDLSWTAPAGASLPYEGSVPEDVLLMAETRRRARDG